MSLMQHLEGCRFETIMAQYTLIFMSRFAPQSEPQSNIYIAPQSNIYFAPQSNIYISNIELRIL